jgi:hypothetical protein
LASTSDVHSSTLGEVPVKGIMHAGGVLRDGSILSVKMQGVRSVYAPKANGLVNIEKVRKMLKKQNPLLYKILSSSVI